MKTTGAWRGAHAGAPPRSHRKTPTTRVRRPLPRLGARPSRLKILAPLAHRDFALLWAGMAVSLLGDGIYFVAVVWEALRLSNTAASVSLVGVAWTLPTVAFLILGGALSDRLPRRGLMLGATLAEALAIGTIGVLAISGALELWMLIALVAVYGAGQAFFLPAFEAIVPTLVGPDEMGQAAALDQFVRPLSIQLVGPAIGGILVAVSGTGPAFLLDAGTFVFAAITLVAISPAPQARRAGGGFGAYLRGQAEAVRFIRANPWLWRTLVAAALTLLLFIGPSQVLLPFVVKNVLHAGSGTLGAIRAAGGLGAVLAAVTICQVKLPGRVVGAMFAGWAIQCLALAGYALADQSWMFAAISLLGGAFGAVGNVVWGTLMKTRVPNQMLGRVASFDWLVSLALVPVSFALTGPVAAALGAKDTLLGGGLIAAVMLVAVGLAPGIERRAPEADRRGPRVERRPRGSTAIIQSEY